AHRKTVNLWFINEFRGAFESDAVFPSVCCECTAISHDQRREKISMIANHDGIFKVRNQLQPIFNELRSDVLAAGRDDEILLAICNLEETIRIEFTDIAGVVPPSCDSFGRFRL